MWSGEGSSVPSPELPSPSLKSSERSMVVAPTACLHAYQGIKRVIGSRVQYTGFRFELGPGLEWHTCLVIHAVSLV